MARPTSTPRPRASALRWVPGLVLVAVALVVAALVRLPVALDEAYYWTWSKELAWSYYDHPPAVALALWLARAGFGDGQLALRITSGLAMLLTAVFIRAAARELAPPGRELGAGRLAWLVLLGALMFTVGYLPATPDPLQGASLALAAWAVGRATRGGGRDAVLASGLAGFLLTAGVLIKHSTGLVAVGALVGALASSAGRRALRRWSTLAGVVLGLALVLPWALADLAAPLGASGFQAARVWSERPPRGLVAVPLTLGALLLTVGPAASWGLAAALRAGVGAGARFIWASGAAALVLGCVVAAGFGTGELNWLMPALAFGAPAVVAAALDLGPRGFRRFTAVSALQAVLVLVVLLHIVYPFAPIPARKDRTLRAAGYDDVAAVVQQVASRHRASRLVTRGYQTASQLRFHLGDSWPVRETASHRRSQYDRWPRPSVCPADVVVLAWNRRDLPPGLEGDRLGPVRTATRARSGRTLDPIFVQALRVTGEGLCDGGAP